jgi:hypothetical protein
LERHLGQNRFFTLGPLAPDYGSYFGLSSLAVNDVPVPKKYQAFVPKYLDPNVDPLVFTGTSMLNPAGSTPAQEFVDHLRAYEAVGVKYLVLPADMVLPGGSSTLRQVFSDATTRILELPRPAPLFSSVSGQCDVHPESESVAAVDCSRPTTIVYRELSMPGWHADANGRSLAVRTYGPVFQSVTVPAGSTTLEFDFTPPHLDLAIIACVLGLGLLVLASPQVRRIRISRRRPQHARHSSDTGSSESQSPFS